MANCGGAAPGGQAIETKSKLHLNERTKTMATKIQAIQRYCPRIKLGPAARKDFYISLLNMRTALSGGVLKNIQECEVEMLITLLLNGQSVHTGAAVYTPSVDLDGKFNVTVRVDNRILRALNVPGAFRGEMENGENVGKTANELVALWNADNPANPVV
jgi:hypothetical protein